MSYNKSPLAFDDIQPLFEQAIASEKGIRVLCTSHAAAIILRSRFNYLRKLDREANAKTFPPEHPLWNRSVYDRLILRVPRKGTQDEHYLYLQKRDPSDLTVEELQ